jgi:hypothetical protein
MKNVQLEVRGQLLIITVDLAQSQGPSASGKTEIIATSAGNIAVPGHEEVKLGLNVYTTRRPR